MPTPTIGTVSSGTLHTEDLLEAFSQELERYAQPDDDSDSLCQDAQHLLDTLERDELDASDKARELLEELTQALEEQAPPYCYFGTIEGDGADFGFWPDLQRIEEDAHAGELLKVSDLSEIPADWIGPVALVNDHGNLTLGHTVAEFREDWSCV